jgi:hypothetical protein
LGLETGEAAQRTRASGRDTYTFSSPFELQNKPASLGLPSRSFIGHLAQVVDFHLNTNYFFFHLAALQEQINTSELHSLPHTSILWHVKLFAIVAMGKLLLEKGATIFGPPGIREFLHAVHILPSNIALTQEPLMAIETLSLLAIYAQSADLHEAAYLYVSLGLWRFHYFL